MRRSLFISPSFLYHLIEAFMAIGQRLLVFCLGKDRMLVADVPTAPDASIKGVRFTNA